MRPKTFSQIHKELTTVFETEMWGSAELNTLRTRWHGAKVKEGLERARRRGQKLGRPESVLPVESLEAMAHLSNSKAAAAMHVSLSTVKRWRRSYMEVIAATCGTHQVGI